MKTRNAVFLIALVLLVPATEASAPQGAVVDRETDTVTETSTNANHVSEKIDFHVTVTSEYQGNWTFEIQPGHQNLRTFATRNGEEQSVNATVVADGSGHDVVYVDLSAIHTAIQTTDTFSIRFEYDVGPTYDRYVTSEPAQLIVYAVPLEGRIPNGEGIPAFVDIGERYHAGVENPSDGQHYLVEFLDAPAAQPTRGTTDFTPYVFAVAGIVVGFLLALFLARKGMIAQKAKKFEKGGTMESRDMLEARRRTLMAALKELELAHEAKEVPDNAYAPLKEEYKAQTVRVMRNLETKNEPGR